jgi:hypothetical protein
MSKYVVGSKILKKEQVLISIFLVTILLLSSGSMVAFASSSNTHIVMPNHHDDTADIQAAFNACGSSPGCTVQLVRGTYYISQIAVYGFQGSFVGMGQGVTTIQALPDLPAQPSGYNIASSPFWAALPTGAIGSDPWPDIFTFVGGSFSISGMTITDPNTAPVSSPGWNNGGYGFYTSLYAAILITGGNPKQEPGTYGQGSASIDHVTVVGASGDVEGTNMWNGVLYGGALLYSDYATSSLGIEDLILISGTFSVTNSVFNTMASGPWVGTLGGATVTVCHNTATNTPGPTYGGSDAYASTLTYCGNQGPAGEFTTVMFERSGLNGAGFRVGVAFGAIFPSLIEPAILGGV